MLKRSVVLVILMLATACGGTGDQRTAVSAPPSPENVQASAANGDILIAWSEVEEAEGYHLYYATEPNIQTDNYAAYENGTWLQDVSSPYELTGVDVSQVYHIVVTAFRASAESPPSNEVKVVPRYVAVGDGSIVRDLATDLEWQRCSVGQTWNAETAYCDGDAAGFNYDEASRQQNAEWRLPTLEQLMSLVYCSNGEPAYFGAGCHYDTARSPSIYSEFFPNTSPRSYFTDTYASRLDGLYWWYVSFHNGYRSITEGSHPYLHIHVRLVRPAR